MSESWQRTLSTAFSVCRFAHFEKAAAGQRFLPDRRFRRMSRNVDRIFGNEQALPIGSGGLKQSPIIPVDRALESCDQLDLSCRKLNSSVFLGFLSHRNIEKAGIAPAFL